jgi:hypothetical protein
MCQSINESISGSEYSGVISSYQEARVHRAQIIEIPERVRIFLIIRQTTSTDQARPRVCPKSRRAPRSTVDWLVLPARVARTLPNSLLPPRTSSRSSSSPDPAALTTFQVSYHSHPQSLLHPAPPPPCKEIPLRRPTN